jgi:carboxypeptidase Q
MKRMLYSTLLLAFTVTAFAQVEKIDTNMMRKIRAEAMNNSKVMDIAWYLTDANGPRLQNSPGYHKAANWAKTKLSSWGLVNANLEPWGEWGKGWELQRSYIGMTAPWYKPIIAFPKTWTSGTKGLTQADVLLISAKDSVEQESYRGKLKGKILLVARNDTLKPRFNRPDASRVADSTLEKMEAFDPANAPARTSNMQRPAPGLFNINRLKEWAKSEGAIAILSSTPRSSDGTLFVQGGGDYTANAPENLLDLVIAYEDYMTINRLLKNKIPVRLELDVKTRFFTNGTKGHNVIAEIPGTDPKLKEELVMLGAHLDSWQGATGATDNAAGCAVMMEAVRILKALGVAPRRTIRIALWGGEEQGLHGSRNYVKNHFTDTTTKTLNSKGDKVSAYFNLDNGTGKIRGIYTQSNKNIKPIFAKWLEPFHDLGAKTVTLQYTGSTDHIPFDYLGLPGFQFIQDAIEYDTRTHHSNMDSYDHLQAADLQQASIIVAAFIYNSAMRDHKLPRKTQIVSATPAPDHKSLR